MDNTLLIGMGEEQVGLQLAYANRHGLIAGATGTGKTVTLQGLAEGFSEAGVPVFVADVKGDLSGLAAPGKGTRALRARAESVGLTDYEPRAVPVEFWDLYGKAGLPVRTTVSEMGPLLLSRLLELNDTQEGVLNVAFAVADDSGWLLLDLKDLRAMLTHVAENAKSLSVEYGRVSTASVGAITRRLLVLEREGGEAFFGEPALDIRHLISHDEDGRGVVNVLAADKLMQSPRLYSTCLLWLLSELFEELPEAGDSDRPKLVFFFDEAHLLFDDAPKVLLDKVEQVVRLIRSKGVGVYFVSQSPADIPEDVLGQLGNRVQHALRAFTPKDRKALRAAAETFRPNPDFNAVDVLPELEVGEALVSTLERKGVPGVVQRTKVRPPTSRMGPLKRAERREHLQMSQLADTYSESVDRESAYEVLQARAEQTRESVKRAPTGRRRYERQGVEAPAPRKRRARQSDSMLEAFAKSALRSVGRQIGRQVVRGLFGSLFKGR